MRLISSSLFFILLSCSSTGPNANANLRAVSVQTDSGTHEFQAEVADSAALRAVGLMGRRDLTSTSAMLFIWSEETEGSFWMKDTPTSLDIVFISTAKKVVSIFTDTVPNSTDLITPSQPYQYVLEFKAGFANQSGLALGDSIVF